MKDYKLICIDNILNGNIINSSSAKVGGVCYYAHTHKEKEKELLSEHLNLTIKYYDLLVSKKGINKIIKECIKTSGNITAGEVETIYSLFINAIYLHDIGKINPSFQINKLNNKNIREKLIGDAKHSIYSAFVFMDKTLKMLNVEEKLFYYWLSFAYVISCHHGTIQDIKNFVGTLNPSSMNYYDKLYYDVENRADLIDIFGNIGWNEDQLRESEINCVPFYILSKLLFSVMILCDFCATSEYHSSEPIEISIIDKLNDYKSIYENGQLYKGIEEYKSDNNFFAQASINTLRSELFIEAQTNLLESLNSNIFYLEAPTGSGKTNVSINLALKILENDKNINNIFYIFPFNTLVEQTAKELKKYFHEDVVVVNCLTPIEKGEESPKNEYINNLALLNRNILNYPIVVTSHVNFFNTLFGIGRESSISLSKLGNSVIIIDEIQSYKNSIWKEIIIMLDYYAKIFNMKIIIMSATLPKLNTLLKVETSSFVELIKNPRKYYENPLFKNRVLIDCSLLEKEISLENLADNVLSHKNKKVLVEFISKRNAREFFNIVKKKDPEILCYELTGDDNKITRDKVISQTKTEKNLIIIATQVIEAGVDIDMDIGFKDISLIDCEEQFLGRINRSCLKDNCVAYFFNYYKKIENIYRNDKRLGYTICDDNIYRLFMEKRFEEIYSLILDDINKVRDKLNLENINIFYSQLSNLNFKAVQERLKLIDDKNTIEIFLSHDITLETGETIKGNDIWLKFQDIFYTDKNYAQKQVSLSLLAAKMDFFLYNIFAADKNLFAAKKFANIYYVENGEDFIDENGKFDSKLFLEGNSGMFL